jgi:hypothetical protein
MCQVSENDWLYRRPRLDSQSVSSWVDVILLVLSVTFFIQASRLTTHICWLAVDTWTRTLAAGWPTSRLNVFHSPSMPTQSWSGATRTGAGTEATPGSSV